MKIHAALAVSTALLLGVIASHQARTVEILPEEEKVVSTPAVPVDDAAVYWIRKYNPAVTEQNAAEMYRVIEQAIERYRSDPSYQCGATRHITPRLVLALILRESSGRWYAISSHGAIGLCQVMPFHAASLHKAGVIESPEVEELLEAEANIRAGVHILMTYAKGVDSVARALARYNAGPSKERYGRGYAKAVLKLCRDIEGTTRI